MVILEICSVENNPENTEDGYQRDVIFSKSVYIESDDFREETIISITG